MLRPGHIALCLVLLFACLSHAAAQQGKIEPGELAGKLLVASPGMRDSRFSKSVVYIASHDADGATGLIVNKPFGPGPLADLMRGFDLDSGKARGKLELHYGGPVSGEDGFALHSRDFKGSDSSSPDGRIFYTADVGILSALAAGKGPERLLFAVGKAVWRPGQLERELAAGVWSVEPATEALVYGDGPVDAWDRASGAGGEPL